MLRSKPLDSRVSEAADRRWCDFLFHARATIRSGPPSQVMTVGRLEADRPPPKRASLQAKPNLRHPQAMTRMTQQETLDLHTRTLSTMTEVLEVLRDEPDSDGTLTDLAERIDAQREWVRASFALGEEPMRPRALAERRTQSRCLGEQRSALDAEAGPPKM
jgi:hypothetical protein